MADLHPRRGLQLAGAAATRLALTARDHPTRSGLAALETVAMAAELVLSAANERRLGVSRHPLEHGRPGRLLKAARTLTASGLVLRLLGRRAGRPSALDHEAVAKLARS